MANESAHAQMRAIIQRLRTLPKELIAQSAPLIGEELKASIDGSVARGQAPDGTPWPLKLDGERALVDAADDVTVDVVGSVIVATLRGKYVLHHKGFARGGVRRQVIPTKKAPQAFINAAKKALSQRYVEIMTRG